MGVRFGGRGVPGAAFPAQEPTVAPAATEAGQSAPGFTPPPSPPVAGELPEDEVEFFDTDGHDHTGSGKGSPVPLAGDLSGDNTAAVVTGLQSTPVSASAPSTDDVLTFDGSEWAPTAPSAGTPRCTIGGWCRANINPITTASEMPDAAGSQPFQALMLDDGTCVAIGVSLSGDVGAAGVNYRLELYKNGVATGKIVDVVGAAGTQNRATNLSANLAFLRTDILTLYDSNTGSAPSAVYARGWLQVEYTP